MDPGSLPDIACSGHTFVHSPIFAILEYIFLLLYTDFFARILVRFATFLSSFFPPSPEGAYQWVLLVVIARLFVFNVGCSLLLCHFTVGMKCGTVYTSSTHFRRLPSEVQFVGAHGINRVGFVETLR